MSNTEKNSEKKTGKKGEKKNNIRTLPTDQQGQINIFERQNK